MCLAIPAKIVELQEGQMVRARVGESETFLNASIALLPESVDVGDYIIVHAGFALHKLREEDAQESLKLLREMTEKVEGKPATF